MFKLLECDGDVLMFNQDTFTVERFKELIRQDFEKNKKSNVASYLKYTSVGTLSFPVVDINWNSNNQDCQILRIGSKGWQQGKIRFQVTYGYSSQLIEVYLEFCPDEPTEPESPLDDLRQLPEYKNGLSPV